MKPKATDFVRRIEQATVVRSIRDGLVNLIPVLTIGAFALIINTFPVEAYQKFITTFADGFIVLVFDMINKATFGVLSVYMTFFVSRAYMKIKADPDAVSGGAVSASMLTFFVLAGANLEKFSLEMLGPKSMFLALIAGLGGSSLYLLLDRLFRKRRRILFSKGADREFNRVLTTLLPIAVIAVTAGLFNALMTRIFDVGSFRELLVRAFNRLFSIGETGFFKGFFFVLFSSILWFFGIHGSDTLEEVMQQYFAPGLAANQAALKAGEIPANILSKQFFDCFVLMGGCGAAICLLISILIFSKNRARRGLGLTAAFPMIFNINELMVFGLPIIFNPIMLIPFLLVPLVCYSVAYLATSLGLVPVITEAIEWTTPIILGGYKATGSFAGSLLQVVNVILGVLIYFPFVRLLDRRTEENERARFDAFMDFFRKNEAEITVQGLFGRGDQYADFAKGLSAEIRHEMAKGIRLAYQPQYHYHGQCTGVEALLRFEHPVYGMLYPPLVIELASEGGFLPDFEEIVMETALNDRNEVLTQFGEHVKISVNVTGKTVISPRFVLFMRHLNEKDPFEGKNLCIEVTEQAMLALNEESRKIFREFREMGLLLAIDDFSMGQTSLHYLKDSLFDIIKLDGSLTKGITVSQNYREIVSSITKLAGTLNLTVLAEFVETVEQKEALHEMGCDVYQGYLYSPAVFLKK